MPHHLQGDRSDLLMLVRCFDRYERGSGQWLIRGTHTRGHNLASPLPAEHVVKRSDVEHLEWTALEP